jgi:Holliday junction resolvase RusA-like endonuclease
LGVRREATDAEAGNQGGEQVSPILAIFIEGIPKPAGSKRAFPFKRRDGKLGVSVTDDCEKSRDWKNYVRMKVAEVYKSEPVAAPLSIVATFHMPRTNQHYRGGNRLNALRDNAPSLHRSKPDATKLWRAVEDALTGIVWADDALIVDQDVHKRYGDKPGVSLLVALVEVPS